MNTLNNVATTDAYSDNTLANAQTERVNLQVTNASIYWRTAGRDRQWAPETFLTPGRYSFDRSCEYVQIRSGAAGVPARVTVEMLGETEVGA